MSDLEWLGHTKIILKADNENVIVALCKSIKRLVKTKDMFENIQEENPTAYDSYSNCDFEVGIRILRSMSRTLNLCLESRMGKYIPAGHPLTAWLLQHACALINARIRGRDDQTAWHRLKGRSFIHCSCASANAPEHADQVAPRWPQPLGLYGTSLSWLCT